ncbi:response regulator [Phormidium pseudopriestleyi FRX01]|uniref:Response regulator n=2 Tax=Phormidium TaxID=1198 RepID=A0ABS3FM10_9CYAN|nr:response regulator [Phormidium pseudopriestleyi FRX01]
MDVKRILLVEDNTNEIELILTGLEENHLTNEVIVVRDGEEALDYLFRRGIFKLRQEGHPLVVILDLKLPKIDGLEVLAQIKSKKDLRQIPVVILSGSREESDMMTSYNLGVNGYVIKPLDFHDFVDTIRSLGLFWAVVNQPPPGSLPSQSRELSDPTKQIMDD